MKYRGIYGKRGRPPLIWKPDISPIFKISHGKYIITFE